MPVYPMKKYIPELRNYFYYHQYHFEEFYPSYDRWEEYDEEGNSYYVFSIYP